MAFESDIDRSILSRLRGSRSASPSASDELLARWERAHGVEFLVRELPPARKAVLSLTFDVHCEELMRVGRALDRCGAECVVLKGVPLALRLYEEPWTRPSVDIDLVVLPEDADRVEDALRALGYEGDGAAKDRFFRRRHFHVHLAASGHVPIELHRLAYRGFGAEIPAAVMFEGKLPSPIGGPSLFIPGPTQELVYLAVHAAAHRFSRIGWLVDVQRLVAASPTATLSSAWALAEDLGFLGPFAAAMLLVGEHLGAEVVLPQLARRARVRLANAIATEPESPLLRTPSRLLYSVLLADTLRARGRYVARTLMDRLLYPSEEE